MPCSCEDTNCPCGIPCCCSPESCKCPTCAIALPNFCKLCNKPLITNIQTNDDKCSCFMGESTVLLIENQNNLQCQVDNAPTPVDHLMCGKLMVDVMVPVSTWNCSQLISQQPICLSPPALTQADSEKSLPPIISREDIPLPTCHEDSGVISSTKMPQFLEYSIGESNNHTSISCHSIKEQTKKSFCLDSRPSPEFSESTENQAANAKTKERGNVQDAFSGYLLSTSQCLNYKHNTKLSCNKECSLPGFSQCTDAKQTSNRVQNIKPKTGERTNMHEPSRLPYMKIGNISNPSSLVDPNCTMQNPEFCISTSSDSSLKCCNSSCSSGLVNATEKITISDKDYWLVPCSNTETKDVQCFTNKVNKNVQTDSTLPLTLKEPLLDPRKISSRGAFGNECFASTFSKNFNGFIPPIPYANYLRRNQKISAVTTSGVQTEPLSVVTPSASGNNDCPQVFPINASAHQTSINVSPAQSNEESGILNWCSPLPEYSEPAATTHIVPEYFRRYTPLQMLMRNAGNFARNQHSQRHCSSVSSTNSYIPLDIEPCTTRNMEPLVRSNPQETKTKK